MAALTFASLVLVLTGSLTVVEAEAHVPGVPHKKPATTSESLCQKRTFLDTFPFFLSSPPRYRQQEITLLTQFSRFANKQASSMLKVGF